MAQRLSRSDFNSSAHRVDSLARTLRQAHSEYAQSVNRSQIRTGHLWQNRFFSCLLDAAHLEQALLYVDRNPVRAGLTAAAWEWPWSSARVHCVPQAADPLLDFDWQMRAPAWDFREWEARLSMTMPEEECAAVRRATGTGEPLASAEFLRSLERVTERRLRVLERGRPRVCSKAKVAHEPERIDVPFPQMGIGRGSIRGLRLTERMSLKANCIKYL